MNPEKRIAFLLHQGKKTLSVAESCTGGLVSHQLTNIPGSSEYFKGGVLAYTNEIKTRILNVPGSIIKKSGAVSGLVAESMAKHVRRLFKSDFGLSITGIAGPTGGTKEKPVGTIYVAIVGPNSIYCKRFQFKGTRLQIKQRAAAAALFMLIELIETS